MQWTLKILPYHFLKTLKTTCTFWMTIHNTICPIMKYLKMSSINHHTRKKTILQLKNCCYHHFITNFIHHDLAIIVVQNLLFIGLYGMDTDAIHLLVMFEHWCRVHCLDTKVICLFILFKHENYVSLHIVYIWKLCT
jgi:hypothetical protein